MPPTRTSQTDPIRVSFVPLALPGRLGLSIAPGKHAGSKSGAPWRRDLATDLDALAKEFKADVLVCLLEDHELQRLHIPSLVSEAEARGLRVHRLPIPDGGVLPRLDAVTDTVAVILSALRAGETTIVHCAGGLGRTGTIAGCVLVSLGHSADEALAMLVEARGRHCPETEQQKAFIRRYAQRPVS